MSTELRAGYKRTEVGVIPNDWNAAPLGEHATFRTGPFGSALHKSDYIDGGVPIVNPMHIVDGRIVPTRTMTVSEQAAESLSEFRIKPGEILIGRRGDMGRCAVIQSDQVGWLCGTGSMIVRPLNTDAEFLQRVLSSPQAISAIEDSSVGTTMINLNQSTLFGLKVQLPPLPEQRAIAEALSDVDALLGGLDRLIAKEQNLKQAAMQQLLTGQTRLPGFSGEWNVKRMGDLFRFSGGYSASRDQLSTEGHCYLHYGDIHGSSKTTIDTSDDFQNIPKLDISINQVSRESLLEDGDVVFVDASEDDDGTSKHVVVVNKENLPFISGLHTIVAKPKTAELAHEYLQFCFQTSAIRKQFMFYAVGTKVSGISKSNIVKLTLPVPTLAEQTAIATILSDMDAELYALQTRRSKTQALKQAMMQELLTGRIRLV